jgi:hypothetical protein
MERFDVVVTLSDGQQHRWEHSDLEAARSQAQRVGIQGFFLTSGSTEEFVPPLRMTKVVVESIELCDLCGLSGVAISDGYCMECRWNRLCQHCAKRQRRRDSVFRDACIEMACQRCEKALRVAGLRYCDNCTKEVRKEMRSSGYLEGSR